MRDWAGLDAAVMRLVVDNAVPRAGVWEGNMSTYTLIGQYLSQICLPRCCDCAECYRQHQGRIRRSGARKGITINEQPQVQKLEQIQVKGYKYKKVEPNLPHD